MNCAKTGVEVNTSKAFHSRSNAGAWPRIR